MHFVNTIKNWVEAIPWESFWSPTSAFTIFPPANWNYMWYYVGFGAICYILLIVLLFLKKKVNPLIQEKINTFLITNIWLCLFLGFFRYQRIPILGMDFLRTIQIVIAIIWLGSIIWFCKITLPKINLYQEVQERKNKYLPKTKKK